ncbi:nuclear RNA export factor 2-like [Anopheles albimanus]|uniref:NTF2 domain-containing protein n=1 Tax=Anopheles albimanus TaxID=7167 RepID=A0A182FKT8_ANOAL|nr:nuclear RNA export factor 2-like [Anopheles albimanus]
MDIEIDPARIIKLEYDMDEVEEKYIAQGAPTSSDTGPPVEPEQAEEGGVYNLESMASQTLHMKTGEADIVIDPRQASPMYDESNLEFDANMLGRVDVWHQVFILHNGLAPKEKIVEMLFACVPLVDFFPVAYRHYQNVDFFLLRMCEKALRTLFTAGLRLKVGQMELPLRVRLCAAKFQQGQIFTRATIAKAVKERADNCQLYGQANLLNLEYFACHPALEELCVCLSNRSQFEMVCSDIGNVMCNLPHINAVKLSNNGICHVTLLAVLKGTQLLSLDLRGNRIRHPSSMRPLKEMPLMELYVEGNPLTDVLDYQQTLRGFFPSLIKLDGSVTYSEANDVREGHDEEEEEVEVVSPGTVIDELEMNPVAFQKFQLTPHWHLVTVHHEGTCGKQTILDAFALWITQYDFYPCYYKTYSKKDEFLVRNCYDALLVVVQNRLRLPLPGSNATLQLTIAMNVAEAGPNQVVPRKKLEQFVMKRYNQNCLDLCSMQAEFNMIKFVDFNAKSPRTLKHIIDIAVRSLGANCFLIRLRNNELENCDGLHGLAKFSWLASLDLRNNSLASFAALNGIPRNLIKEVFLDRNPLCDEKPTCAEYIREVKRYFPQLERLDGRPLLGDGVLSYCQNYICSPDAYKFADAFVAHYFKLQDSFQRAALQDLYHPQALFSMTCNFANDRSVAQDANVQRQLAYNEHSRNLLKLNKSTDDVLKSLVVGNESIRYVLNSFPSTEYDLMSFRIEVPIFTPDNVLITVHGRVKEGINCEMGFTRTFYIQPAGKGKGLFSDALDYKIYNDLFHMYTLSEEGRSYMDKREADEIKRKQLQQPQENVCSSEADDRESTLIVFKQLTKLNRKWCVRCLDESSWNLKVALNVFLKLYEARRIPKLAFIESDD